MPRRSSSASKKSCNRKVVFAVHDPIHPQNSHQSLGPFASYVPLHCLRSKSWYSFSSPNVLAISFCHLAQLCRTHSSRWEKPFANARVLRPTSLSSTKSDSNAEPKLAFSVPASPEMNKMWSDCQQNPWCRRTFPWWGKNTRA